MMKVMAMAAAHDLDVLGGNTAFVNYYGVGEEDNTLFADLEETLKLVRDEESYTVRSFFKSFKENFKQGSVIGIIMTLLLVFFLYDIYVYL